MFCYPFQLKSTSLPSFFILCVSEMFMLKSFWCGGFVCLLYGLYYFLYQSSWFCNFFFVMVQYFCFAVIFSLVLHHWLHFIFILCVSETFMLKFFCCIGFVCLLNGLYHFLYPNCTSLLFLAENKKEAENEKEAE